MMATRQAKIVCQHFPHHNSEVDARDLFMETAQDYSNEPNSINFTLMVQTAVSLRQSIRFPADGTTATLSALRRTD